MTRIDPNTGQLVVDTDGSNVNPFGDMLVTTVIVIQVASTVTSCVAYNCINRQKTMTSLLFCYSLPNFIYLLLLLLTQYN